MKTRILILMLFVLVDVTLLAGPLLNADFEAVLGNEWTVKNSLPPVGTSPPSAIVNRVPGTRDSTRDSSLGAWVIETTVRDDVQDGPQQGGTISQNFMTALANAGNGRTYTTRFWINSFPRPPVRPNGSFRGLPQKANSC